MSAVRNAPTASCSASVRKELHCASGSIDPSSARIVYSPLMRTQFLSVLSVVFLFMACSDPGTTTSSTKGAGGNAGTGGTGGDGGSAGNASGGNGGASPMACAPLPKANGQIIDVDVSKAAELPGIVAGAPSGSTLVLAKGTYTIPATLQFTKTDVTLRSATDNATDVIIDGAYAVNETIAISASNVTIAHVTVTRAVDHPIHVYPPGAGVDVKGTYLYGLRLIDGGEQFVKVNPIVGQTGYVDEGRVECSHFELTDAGRPNVEPCCGGCYTGGIDVHAGWKWQVRNNTFRGIYCNTGLAEHAIHFWKGSRDTLVENNVIIDCGRGIGFGLGSGGGDRKYPDNPYGDPNLAHYDGIIRNNVVYGDIAGFDTGIEIAEAKEPHLYHNTVVKGDGASGFFSGIDYRFAQTSAIIRNNLTSRITQRDGAVGTVDTNFENVPLNYFVNPNAGDFHLTTMATSAIDKGVPVNEAGIDIDGEQHALGPAPDLGADESKP